MIDKSLREYHNSIQSLVDAWNNYWPRLQNFYVNKPIIIDEDNLYPIDRTFDHALNSSKQVALEIYKIIESGKTYREHGLLLGNIEISPIPSISKSNAKVNSPTISRVECKNPDTGAYITACELGIAWGQLPYMNKEDPPGISSCISMTDITRLASSLKSSGESGSAAFCSPLKLI